ncbi:lambda phage CII family protein [Erwiniaceae bacterium BAC15a-03b]|uniref:Lambda phage CII family protein n=1 Tax=Winslowiella arboricola TaxID=2978220 RepID=A0A9J6PYC1_9GAMM|nr:CII family transcriptional regulator [Winslowiella arboricola]MCU5775090.1 lambda phage CII family protein [Winslowiella arboricola]MCU5780456.1 lambda phage CII family protein [Winslowiella arboricola]
MESANYSKPTQREVDRAETDLLLAVSALTGREFAKSVGCHESKISRADWRFIAAVICTARMAWEVSPVGRLVLETINAIAPKEKAPSCGNSFDA